MKVVVKPKSEEVILASTKKSATSEEIRRALLARSDNCVDSRCGCGTCS